MVTPLLHIAVPAFICGALSVLALATWLIASVADADEEVSPDWGELRDAAAEYLADNSRYAAHRLERALERLDEVAQ